MPAEVGTLADLLLFYTVERSLFNRMVTTLGPENSRKVKRAIALWLLLEENGYHGLIRTIHSQNDKTIEALFNEALLLLERRMIVSSNHSSRDSTMLQKRYEHIMESVCDRIFGETAAIAVDESGTRPRPVVTNPEAERGYSSLNLNPEASEFSPGNKRTAEDARTMFLTFSKGHPLTRQEIINFFTSELGDVVEDVFIEKTRSPGQDPAFGRIVFTTPEVIPRVLNGEGKAKFLVNGKHLWARTYVNRHAQKRTTRIS